MFFYPNINTIEVMLFEGEMLLFSYLADSWAFTQQTQNKLRFSNTTEVYENCSHSTGFIYLSMSYPNAQDISFFKNHPVARVN